MIREKTGEQKRYWPFEVLPPEERTEQHEREIRLLEATHRRGYSPYSCVAGDLGATAEGRGGLIVVRGRGRWEVILGTAEARIASAFVNDFDCAAQAVLEWLRGADAADILSCVQGHLVRMPGAAHSFVLDAVARLSWHLP
jgi:hypothetical protein